MTTLINRPKKKTPAKAFKAEAKYKNDRLCLKCASSKAHGFNVTDFFSGQQPDMTKMANIISSGFPVEVVREIRSNLDLDNRYLAYTMGISEKTLIRRSQSNQKLSPVESDRLYRIMRIFNVAIRALNDKDAAKKWLHRPQRGLGGRVPMDIIQTEPGAVEVENLLGRIEYGVYS